MAEEKKLLEVEDVRQRIQGISARVAEMADYIKVEERRAKLAELEAMQAEADFWSSQAKARDVISKTNAERAYVAPFDALRKTVEDAGVMLELAEMEEGPRSRRRSPTRLRSAPRRTNTSPSCACSRFSAASSTSATSS